MVELNRRTFLSGSVAAGAAALFGTEAAHAAGAVKLPTKWDETADVVIVGSGFAGLAAAIEAKKAGASVVVLEKMATVGGNSIINGGILTATGSAARSKRNTALKIRPNFWLTTCSLPASTSTILKR